jgi:hypothetical protein
VDAAAARRAGAGSAEVVGCGEHSAAQVARAEQAGTGRMEGAPADEHGAAGGAVFICRRTFHASGACLFGPGDLCGRVLAAAHHLG